MKITDYKIVTGGSTGDCAARVTEELKKGYQPWGDPFVFQGPTHFTCQALVKYEEANPKDYQPKPEQAAMGE
jgi:hypothetical protein